MIVPIMFIDILILVNREVPIPCKNLNDYATASAFPEMCATFDPAIPFCCPMPTNILARLIPRT